MKISIGRGEVPSTRLIMTKQNGPARPLTPWSKNWVALLMILTSGILQSVELQYKEGPLDPETIYNPAYRNNIYGPRADAWCLIRIKVHTHKRLGQHWKNHGSASKHLKRTLTPACRFWHAATYPLKPQRIMPLLRVSDQYKAAGIPGFKH